MSTSAMIPVLAPVLTVPAHLKPSIDWNFRCKKEVLGQDQLGKSNSPSETINTRTGVCCICGAAKSDCIIVRYRIREISHLAGFVVKSQYFQKLLDLRSKVRGAKQILPL